MTLALYASLFLVATCGLVYELVAGALASYLLGDTVLQFSTVIGAYLFAMGVGSWASRYVGRGLVARFVQIEILVGLVGGFSSTLLFLAFAHVAGFRILLYLIVFIVGALVGLEIPLMMRILRDRLEFKDLVSQVLTMDYLGALIASVLFPLVLVPRLGLLNTALFFGLVNVGVAAATLWLLRDEIPRKSGLGASCAAAALALTLGLVFSSHIAARAEGDMYADEVIFARTTRYQRLVLTRWKDDWRLFLNGSLQFSTMDEYRYHEALVHPALSAHRAPRAVLILGGGDGLAAREVLRDPRVGHVTLVDLDPEMTRLFSQHEMLSRLNGHALTDARTTVVNADAFRWLEDNDRRFDVVIVDFPDPSNYAVGKLFTTAFYRLLRRRLAPGGVVSVQATSPLFARTTFWTVVATMDAGGFQTSPYHAYVPSFGEWGFVIGATAPYKVPERFPSGLRYLTPEIARGLFDFPADMSRVPAEANRLDTQILVQQYEREWARINHGG
ncbi:MAG: spermidine synthase [Elusimicrobia bacterium RBG_16_66_12]|nr:MAG: spermidine synthase [Elusimicrobia bacterium RBG_16_66_12]